ncbi:MAG: SirB2 family protein [Bacteroidota bacterium]|nr:SirB2 family protein [Bacteroidota bacterium]
MYTGLLHTHRLVVTLFLIIYFVKMILLLMNKKNQLDSFRKWIKVPEIIVSSLFLITGVWMILLKPTVNYMQVFKLIAVVAAIPCGVIGFARYNKVLGTLSFVLIVAAYGLAEMSKKIVIKEPLDKAIVIDEEAVEYDQLIHGEALYSAYCVQCHGKDGKLMLQEASDLSNTQMDRNEMMEIIYTGKGRMPAFNQVLTAREMEAVVTYVETLRQD